MTTTGGFPELQATHGGTPMTGYATLVDDLAVEMVQVLGPTITFLTPPDGSGDAPCVMRGTIPPGDLVPLHSHAEPETFLLESGELEAFAGPGEWLRLRAGDVLHVPGDAPHAFRNDCREPAVTIVVTTARIGRFFREVGRPSADPLATFLAVSERYGYWNATPEENAAIGIVLPGSAR